MHCFIMCICGENCENFIQISVNCDPQGPIIDLDELTSMGQICAQVPDSKIHGANMDLAIWGGRFPREMLF